MDEKWAGCYSTDELRSMGLRHVGKNVLISKDVKIYNPAKLSIGNNVRIDDFCILTGDIEIENYVHIGAYCLLSGKYGIKLKNFSGLSAKTCVYTATDDYVNGTSLTNPTIPPEFHKIISGSVIFEEHVIVGVGTVLLPNVHLQEGVAIGAQSLVKSGTYESWHLFAGIPAVKKKKRPNEIILNDAKKIMNKLNQN